MPEDLPPGHHGDPIYQRLLDNETAKLSQGRNWLVLYHSQDAHDNPIAVSGIIVLPTDPPRTEAGYPLVSWAHGTVGVAHQCAPSRDWPASDTHPMNAYCHALLNGFLDQGWAVAMTDYEGLGVARGNTFYRRHPFMHGKSQANGVLDIVLTARRLFSGQIIDQFAIAGHSQGGQAALFAASHAPGRVGGLAGVAAIAPANHPLDLVKAGAYVPIFNEGFAFTPLFLAGAMGGDPTILPAEVLSVLANANWSQVDTKCRAGLADSFWGKIVWGNTQFRRADPNEPNYPGSPNDAQRKFNAQLHAMNPDLSIDVPIRISQAADDERVRAATKVEDLNQISPGLGEITIRGTNALVDELLLTNQRYQPELVYKCYDPGLVEVPAHDPGNLGVHFATMNHDRQALTDWISEQFADGQAS